SRARTLSRRTSPACGGGGPPEGGGGGCTLRDVGHRKVSSAQAAPLSSGLWPVSSPAGGRGAPTAQTHPTPKTKTRGHPRDHIRSSQRGRASRGPRALM